MIFLINEMIDNFLTIQDNYKNDFGGELYGTGADPAGCNSWLCFTGA